MDKKFLLSTASHLIQLSTGSSDEYQQKAEQLAAQMNILMINKPDIEGLVGGNNIGMMKDNHANHVRFMVSVFKTYNAEVLVETVLWVFRAYRSHGFTTNYWSVQLNTWIGLLKEILTPGCYKEVYPYYEWMVVNIPVFVKISDEKLLTPDSLN